MSYSLISGDLEPDMELTILVDGEVWPLELGDIIELNYVDPNAVEYTKTLDVVDSDAGLVVATWTSGETDVTGTYFGVVKLTRDSETRSFPNDGSKIIWNVYPDVGDNDC